MHRLALAILLVGCSKTDSPSPRPPEPPSLAAVNGVVITAKDVLVNGKSLGTLPERLATDRTALVAAIRAMPVHPQPPNALSYTDDAPAPVILAAVRAMNEALATTAPAVIPDSGPTGTAMALDEGKLGSAADARAKAIAAARASGVLASSTGEMYSIIALGNGKPQRVCDARAGGVVTDDEQVDLSVVIGAKQWRVAISRINEIELLDAPAKVASSLHTSKMTAFFADRADIELAAETGTTGADLTPIITAACATGFFEIRPLSPAEVAAQLDRGTRRDFPHGAPDTSSVNVGTATSEGALDKAIIRRYIKRHIQKLSSCYDHEVATKPALRGTVQAHFVISPTGTVSTSEATGVDPAVASCVASTIKAIEFPKPKDGHPVEVNYPFTFTPAPAPAASP